MTDIGRLGQRGCPKLRRPFVGTRLTVSDKQSGLWYFTPMKDGMAGGWRYPWMGEEIR
jgi:hypothetical protein